ncbi:hypothetical protein BDK51DRAFT_36590 [Blyttiomyces helicus]|uniref:Uncharacterized protein n=1 Tax=Blyttiomyces helicus TaxID=388810 RepID=A0A4P9WGI3_9FUNG|nr:hypothetical protein BDK51DRAFT_36590 [Blyttiomyces helicus]|eukprot:RKO90478.1 hypothetical protein BDK51DRAFT_36590 [Blyttiomyces helicus]
MSDHGYYRLSVAETLVMGEANRDKLRELEVLVREFMELKKLPEWMKEENLGAGLKNRKEAAGAGSPTPGEVEEVEEEEKEVAKGSAAKGSGRAGREKGRKKKK